MNSPVKYLHISYEPADKWLLPLLGRLNGSTNEELRSRIAEWPDQPISETGLALTTKLSVLRVVQRRLDDDLKKVGHDLRSNPEAVHECVHRGAALRLVQDELPYELLTDIDSFLFETRSCYEIATHFLQQFFRDIFNRDTSEREITGMLAARGIDTRWIKQLHSKRILFFHKTAPWVALKMLPANAPSIEVLILEENVKDLSNEEGYFELSLLQDIYEGFYRSLDAIRDWILDLVAKQEQSADRVTRDASGRYQRNIPDTSED